MAGAEFNGGRIIIIDGLHGGVGQEFLPEVVRQLNLRAPEDSASRQNENVQPPASSYDRQTENRHDVSAVFGEGDSEQDGSVSAPRESRSSSSMGGPAYQPPQAPSTTYGNSGGRVKTPNEIYSSDPTALTLEELVQRRDAYRNYIKDEESDIGVLDGFMDSLSPKGESVMNGLRSRAERVAESMKDHRRVWLAGVAASLAVLAAVGIGVRQGAAVDPEVRNKDITGEGITSVSAMVTYQGVYTPWGKNKAGQDVRVEWSDAQFWMKGREQLDWTVSLRGIEMDPETKNSVDKEQLLMMMDKKSGEKRIATIAEQTNAEGEEVLLVTVNRGMVVVDFDSKEKTKEELQTLPDQKDEGGKPYLDVEIVQIPTEGYDLAPETIEALNNAAKTFSGVAIPVREDSHGLLERAAASGACPLADNKEQTIRNVIAPEVDAYFEGKVLEWSEKEAPKGVGVQMNFIGEYVLPVRGDEVSKQESKDDRLTTQIKECTITPIEKETTNND